MTLVNLLDTKEGAIAFTFIPYLAHSTASAFVRFISPAFEELSGSGLHVDHK